MDEPAWIEQALEIDREDLYTLLQMRFGAVPGDVAQRITQVRKPDVLQRLILAAANVPDWPAFVRELAAGEAAFRLVGEDYNPLARRGETR
ncbi:MAG: hypothetical protein K6T78_07845 [Alicyclobacillus sp.]|nr:hypothetical protein [Alicyclobacillus sp.]